MKTKSLLQFTLLLTVMLIATSEGFFFEYPKKVLTEFLHSLKEKKEAKKRPQVHHYHVHYYPVTLPSSGPVKAPKKHELEELHNDHLATLGWSEHEYKYVPEPRIEISSSLYDTWEDDLPWKPEILESDFLEEQSHSKNEGIYLQIPYDETIVAEQPHSYKKLKGKLLSNFFHKILDSKNSVHS